ncbi:hypothetical protein J6590_068533 [Homalodisca vitripennis]|nr:hypothetical protein J6590_068533 [Homalodisca vitripennis]
MAILNAFYPVNEAILLIFSLQIFYRVTDLESHDDTVTRHVEIWGHQIHQSNLGSESTSQHSILILFPVRTFTEILHYIICMKRREARFEDYNTCAGHDTS